MLPCAECGADSSTLGGSKIGGWCTPLQRRFPGPDFSNLGHCVQIHTGPWRMYICSHGCLYGFECFRNSETPLSGRIGGTTVYRSVQLDHVTQARQHLNCSGRSRHHVMQLRPVSIEKSGPGNLPWRGGHHCQFCYHLEYENSPDM